MIGSFDFSGDVAKPIEHIKPSVDEDIEYEDAVYSATSPVRRVISTAGLMLFVGVFTFFCVRIVVSSSDGTPLMGIFDHNFGSLEAAATAPVPHIAESDVQKSAYASDGDSVVSSDSSSVEDKNSVDVKDADKTKTDGTSKSDNAVASTDAKKDSASVSTGTNQGVRRITHQRNTAERVDASVGAWGIEVDVRGLDETDDVMLYHDDDHGYRLPEFLKTCKERSQVAILDLKSGFDAEATVDAVVKAGMTDMVRFQTASCDTAATIRELAPWGRIWLLNGWGDEDEEVRLEELSSHSDLFCGINVYGDVIGENPKAVVKSVHNIKSADGKPMEMCIFGYGETYEVCNDTEEFEQSGVDFLMANLVPPSEDD